MKITEVRVFPMNEDKLKAYATITFEDCFVVRDLKVISGNSGLFVAMPSKKRKDGTFKDIAHPLNNEFRDQIEKAVLETYHKETAPQATTASATQASQKILSPPDIQSKTPDQVNPQDYSAPDD